MSSEERDKRLEAQELPDLLLQWAIQADDPNKKLALAARRIACQKARSLLADYREATKNYQDVGKNWHEAEERAERAEARVKELEERDRLRSVGADMQIRATDQTQEKLKRAEAENARLKANRGPGNLLEVVDVLTAENVTLRETQAILEQRVQQQEKELTAANLEVVALRADRDRLEAIRCWLAEDDFPMVRRDVLRALASGKESRAAGVKRCRSCRKAWPCPEASRPGHIDVDPLCDADPYSGGEVCSKCGGRRAASGVDGGLWVHLTYSPRRAEGAGAMSETRPSSARASRKEGRVAEARMPRDWKHTERCMSGVRKDVCICWPPVASGEENR